MNNSRITSLQMISIDTIFMIGSVIVTSIPAARQDIWLCVIFGTVLAIPLMLCYGRILKLYPGQSYFDILITVYGKIAGKLLIAVYIIYAVHLGGMVIRTFTEFINIESLPETPQIPIQCLMILIIVFLAKTGIENLGRVCRFLLPILLIIIAITLSISIGSMKIQNLFPIFGVDPKAIASVSMTIACLPYGETVLLGALFSSYVQDKPPVRIFIYAMVINFIIMLAINLRNVLVLGMPSGISYYFATYEAARDLSIVEMFSRAEILVGITYTLAGTIKSGFCVIVAATGMAKLFDIEDMRIFAGPAALLVLLVAVGSAKNTLEHLEWVQIYIIIGLPYQLIIPLATLVTAEIKVRRQKALAARQVK